MSRLLIFFMMVCFAWQANATGARLNEEECRNFKSVGYHRHLGAKSQSSSYKSQKKQKRSDFNRKLLEFRQDTINTITRRSITTPQTHSQILARSTHKPTDD